MVLYKYSPAQAPNGACARPPRRACKPTWRLSAKSSSDQDFVDLGKQRAFVENFHAGDGFSAGWHLEMHLLVTQHLDEAAASDFNSRSRARVPGCPSRLTSTGSTPGLATVTVPATRTRAPGGILSCWAFQFLLLIMSAAPLVRRAKCAFRPERATSPSPATA